MVVTFVPLVCVELRGADLIRGAVNGDGVVTMADVYSCWMPLSWLFPPLECSLAADADDNGRHGSGDITRLFHEVVAHGVGDRNLPLPGTGGDL
jgi:hypothetical protein